MAILARLSLAFSLTGALHAAGPDLLALAPPDSALLVGINLEQIKSSKLGQSLFSQMKIENSDLKQWMDASGFDPLRDVREILIATPAVNRKARGLFFVRGSFDAARFAALARRPGVSLATYQGVSIFTKKQQEPVSLACLDSSLVIGGDPESVRTAVARRGGSGGPDPALAAKANELRRGQDIWVVARVSPSELAGDVPVPEFAGALQGDFVKSVRRFSGGLKFGPELLLSADLVTRTAEDAAGIAAALKMLLGLATSDRQNANSLAPLLEKLNLRADGDTVKIALAVPEEQLAQLFQSSLQGLMQGARKTAAAPAPPAPPRNDVIIYSSPKDMGVVKVPR